MSEDNDIDDEVTIIGHGKVPQLRKLSHEELPEEEADPIEVIIKDWISDRTIRVETHFFNVRCISKKNGRDWEIQRRYSDF